MYISVRHMILKERRSKKKNLSNPVRKSGTNLWVFKESTLLKKISAVYNKSMKHRVRSKKTMCGCYQKNEKYVRDKDGVQERMRM